MSFDGGYLRKITLELESFIGARIDKISQPARFMLVFLLRGFSGNKKLLFSADPSTPRIHFTSTAIENPASPPMFCMLLRKKLGGGKLIGVEQSGLDRVLTLRFEASNELGDKVEYSLIFEIMGRRSNVVLLDNTDKIIDALKRVDFVASETRPILPGMRYPFLPAQDKLDITLAEPDKIFSAVTAHSPIALSKAVSQSLQGISPVVAREISFLVCGSCDPAVGDLSESQLLTLRKELISLKNALLPGGGIPTLIISSADSSLVPTPCEFSYIPLKQYPENSFTHINPGSFSELLDLFYHDKDAAEGIRQSALRLDKLLHSVHNRLTRKLAVRREELLKSEDRDRLRKYGDIISANFYSISQGDRMLKAVDFFSEEDPQPVLEIPLDPRLSPSKNAQKYYSEYRKQSNAHALLLGLVEECERELAYIDSAIDELSRCKSEAELAEIREELVGQGYLEGRAPSGRKGRAVSKKRELTPLKYISSDGFVILCGRNNLQNDRLTLKTARSSDIWFHAQKIPGSHTVVISEGKPVPDTTLTEAAVIAACNSKGCRSAKVAVDYAPIKNVKKPNGSPPGMVIYEGYNTAYVSPDTSLADSLLEHN